MKVYDQGSSHAHVTVTLIARPGPIIGQQPAGQSRRAQPSGTDGIQPTLAGFPRYGGVDSEDSEPYTRYVDCFGASEWIALPLCTRVDRKGSQAASRARRRCCSRHDIESIPSPRCFTDAAALGPSLVQNGEAQRRRACCRLLNSI
jgi:hypothetical protein